MSDLFSFYKGKRILVTGHTGFKGSWLCTWLNHIGAEVRGYALEPYDVRGNHFKILNLESKIDSVIGDIRDYPKFEAAINEFNPDIVFHLAAFATVRDSYSDTIDNYASNVMGTVNLFDILNKRNKPVSIVNITSDKCYLNKETNYPYDESDELGGHDPYSASKACAEIVTNSFRKSFFYDNSPIKLASARSGNIIGGGDFVKDRIIPDIFEAISKNEKVELRSPNSVRPWQYILDVLYGYLLLGKKLHEDNSREIDTAFNFAPTEVESVPVEKLTQLFIKYIGQGEYSVNEAGKNLHEANLLLLNSNKAKNILGWQNKFNVEESTRETADWYKTYLQDETKAPEMTIKQIENYSRL
jgi:CDP-glucose 4,6-dehydratase